MLIGSGERPLRPTEGVNGPAGTGAIDLSGIKGQRGGGPGWPADDIRQRSLHWSLNG